jgi:mono/diheme cytochrome c family protein
LRLVGGGVRRFDCINGEHGRREQFAGAGDVLGALAAGEQAIITDAMEACGEHVDEKAADERMGREGMGSMALSHVRDASIERHAQVNPPLSLDDPTIVHAGARAFSERGCVNCHGGPGVDWAKFSEGMHPDPADLKELANETSPQELFWVIKNGINMTGMPSFGAINVPDQEIWTIVAFVKKLRGCTAKKRDELASPYMIEPHASPRFQDRRILPKMADRGLAIPRSGPDQPMTTRQLTRACHIARFDRSDSFPVWFRAG